MSTADANTSALLIDFGAITLPLYYSTINYSPLDLFLNTTDLHNGLANHGRCEEFGH
ncbi:MAG: hypothetical protein AAF098_12150 [Pseudomonadota bacterium]